MPPVTKNIIIINVLFFLGTIVAAKYGIDLSQLLGLHLVIADTFNPAQLFTYMFMHANLSHLFFNMFAVWMFGRVLEQVWGPRRFLFYYIACGLGAGIIQEIVQYIYYVPGLSQFGDMIPQQVTEFINRTHTVGASGAVFAILLGFGMLFPNQSIFIFPLPIPIKAKFFVIGYAALELYLGVSNNANDNVAHFAHLGGMVIGFIIIMYWKRKNRNGTFYQ